MDLRIPIGGNQLPDWMKKKQEKERKIRKNKNNV